MSEQELISAAKAAVIAYNNKDWAAVAAACGDNVTYDEVATHRKIDGVGQIIEAWQGWANAFPDSKATFHSERVSGNQVILELTWTGTHTGPMMSPGGEIPPTNKSMSMRACQICTIEDGKVGAMVQYFDMMTMMTQLGLAG